MFLFQATIGIDFLSKTMYLEDRTVSLYFFLTHKLQFMQVIKPNIV